MPVTTPKGSESRYYSVRDRLSPLPHGLGCPVLWGSCYHAMQICGLWWTESAEGAVTVQPCPPSPDGQDACSLPVWPGKQGGGQTTSSLSTTHFPLPLLSFPLDRPGCAQHGQAWDSGCPPGLMESGRNWQSLEVDKLGWPGWFCGGYSGLLQQDPAKVMHVVEQG